MALSCPSGPRRKDADRKGPFLPTHSPCRSPSTTLAWMAGRRAGGRRWNVGKLTPHNGAARLLAAPTHLQVSHLSDYHSFLLIHLLSLSCAGNTLHKALLLAFPGGGETGALAGSIGFSKASSALSLCFSLSFLIKALLPTQRPGLGCRSRG